MSTLTTSPAENAAALAAPVDAPDARVGAARPRRAPLRWGPLLMVLPALAVFAVFLAVPMAQTVWGSLFSFSLADPTRRFVGAGNYAEMLGDSVFWRGLVNNLVILAGSVVVQVGGGLVLAWLLDRGVRRFRGLFRTLLFVPMTMSVVAVGLLWQFVYYPAVGLLPRTMEAVGLAAPALGFLGDPTLVTLSILAVTCWQYTGFVMVILLSGMQAVPDSLFEAARLDGATEWQVFTRVVVPSIRPVVVVAVLLTMVGAFKVFDHVYVLTGGGPANASQVLGTYLYQNAFTLDRMGYACAIAVVLLVVTFALGVAQLRVGGQTGEGR